MIFNCIPLLLDWMPTVTPSSHLGKVATGTQYGVANPPHGIVLPEPLRRRSRRAFSLDRWFLAFFANVFVCCPLSAHDLPDGQVERALQVTAYPDRIEVKYQFGLSERTMWKELRGAGESKEVDIGGLDREELAALEAEYLEKVAGELPGRMELLLAGERQEQPSISKELIYQHHLQFECRLVYPCTVAAEPCSFELTDQNFAAYPGHYRVAVRGRGGREALSDRAALLLVRAPRLPIQAERLGKLVVPPIQATVGSDLASASVRVASSSSPQLILRGKDSITPQATNTATKLPGPPHASRLSVGKDVLLGSSGSAASSSRTILNWFIGGFILLAAILCLPPLFLNRRSSTGP
jgi:hypothetical protein